MPAFNRQLTRFNTGPGGVNLNYPIDQIPQGQYSMLKNLRPYVNGQWTTRPGLTLLSNDFGSVNYLHSILRYSDSNPETSVAWARFIGADTELFTGQTTFTSVASGFSGNPLSMVAFRANGQANASVYIGDSAKMISVTYLPADTPEAPTVFTAIGISPPNGTGGSGGFTTPTAGAAGALNGSYWWRFAARNRYTGARSNPSSPTRVNMTSNPVLPGIGGGLALVNQRGTLTLPDHYDAGLAYGSEIIIDVYRFGGTVYAWKHVGTGEPGAAFSDDLPDSSVLSAPSFPVDFNGVPSLIQPFMSTDINRTGGCTLAQPGGAGTPTFLTITSGAPPTAVWENYPPGTQIVVDGKNIYTTYRFADSASVVELTEDAYTQIGGGPFTWEVPSGATIVNQPFAHLWGPYGSGQIGLVMFACGDPRNPGTLSWTNGNDPDSQSPEGFLEITDPTEPLVNGMIWNGRNYLWSTKRMFEIIPDLGNPGNFLVQQIPGAGGLYAPWAIADCGSFMAYVGFDGIYKSTGVGSESLTDAQLYPWFPHETQPGIAFVRGGDTLNPADTAYLQKWRLAWQFGELYFDYPEVTTGHNKAWVRGTRPDNDKGWIQDDYNFDGATSRGVELTPVAGTTSGVSAELIGIGGSLYQLAGNDDGGFNISFILETPLWDAGDPRGSKLWGDGTLEIVTNKAIVGSSDMTLTLLGDPIAGGQPTGVSGFVTNSIPNTGGTKSFQISSPNNINRTQGIRITGALKAYSPEFYSWEPSFVLKPETISARIDDWSDDGVPGNKLVRGCVIEGDTGYASGTDLVCQANLFSVSSASRPFVSGDVGAHLVILSGTGWFPDVYVILSVAAGVATLDHPCAGGTVISGTWSLGIPKAFTVQGDGGFLGASITVSHPGQSEAPYFWVPFESHNLRLSPSGDTSVEWKEFKVRWIYDNYPEFGTQIEDYTHLPQPLYIRGFELEVSTKGQSVSFQFQGDLGQVLATTTVNTQVKDILAFGFPVPFVISEYRVVPLGSWEKFNLRLIGDPYPDFAAITTQYLLPASGRPAHIRGFSLRADTRGSAVNIRVMADNALAQTVSLTSTNQGIIGPFVLSPPKIAKLIQFVPSGSWRFWDVIWDAEEYPELTTERTRVMSLNGCKLVQGLRLPADTNGAQVSFEIHGDQEVLQGVTTPQAWTGKTTIAFPRANEFQPFFAHNLYLVPLEPARVWTDEIEWIFQPAPDLGTSWSTPPMTMGFKNWWSARFIWLGRASTSAVTIVVTTDLGTETYVFPSTNGVYQRSYLETLPTKSKYRSFVASSPEPFRLYLADTFILAKEFGRPYDEFSPMRIFGDDSVENSGARI